MKDANLTSLLKPLVDKLGYEFVGLEYSSNPKNAVLVVYIDRPGGISVNDCETVSREISALLDVEDPVAGHYVLQVSSPGLDRPLFTLDQFARFIGETAQVSLHAAVNGRRRYKGTIVRVGEGAVIIDQDGVEVALDYANVARARLVPDFDSLLSKHG